MWNLWGPNHVSKLAGQWLDVRLELAKFRDDAIRRGHRNAPHRRARFDRDAGLSIAVQRPFIGMREARRAADTVSHLKSSMPKPLDLTQRVRQHMEWSRKRDHWARRAIDLLAQGKDKAGMEAAKKAEAWDVKVKALEP